MIFKTDPDILENYTSDASNLHGNADCLFIPESIEEIKEAIETCRTNSWQISTSGAGTGLVGGRVPFGGAVISMEKLNKIISLNPDKRTVKVETGITVTDLDREIRNHGFFFAPNPTEKNSSIGGNIATNASGARTFKYGATRRWVRYLRVLLSNGDELRLNKGEFVAQDGQLSIKSLSGKDYSFKIPQITIPDVKHAAGYYLTQDMDAIDLFTGSEGTLGIIAEAEIELIPIAENVLGLIIFFDRLDGLFEFVEEARSHSRRNNELPNADVAGLSARLIEFMDENSLNLLRKDHPQIPENACGSIWIEQEYSFANEEKIMETWMELITRTTSLDAATWVALNFSEHEKFRDFRHELPLKIVDILMQNKQVKFNPDGAVPDEYLRYFFGFVKNEIVTKQLGHVIFGHIGNNHLHANVFIKDEHQLQSADEFYDNCVTEALRLGGTISAEHGVGKIKVKYLNQMFGDKGIEEMKKIKKIFDPDNLLGINTLFV